MNVVRKMELYGAGIVDHHACCVLNVIYIYTLLKCCTTEISGLAYILSQYLQTNF